MSEHTHLLAKPHRILGTDGKRITASAGTPITPTEAQLQNMPDVFLLRDGHAVGEFDEKHDMRGKSVGSIKDHIADISDFEVLEEMAAEESQGRNRPGAMNAITKRTDFVIAENEEAAGSEEG